MGFLIQTQFLYFIYIDTTRFDIKSFKEKHPEIYDQFLIGGESVELKTNYKKAK